LNNVRPHRPPAEFLGEARGARTDRLIGSIRRKCQSRARPERATPPPQPYLLLRLLPSRRAPTSRSTRTHPTSGPPSSPRSGGAARIRRPAPSLQPPSRVASIAGPLYPDPETRITETRVTR